MKVNGSRGLTPHSSDVTQRDKPAVAKKSMIPPRAAIVRPWRTKSAKIRWGPAPRGAMATASAVPSFPADFPILSSYDSRPPSRIRETPGYCLTTAGVGSCRRRYSFSVKPSIIERVWAAFAGFRSWAALKMGSVAISRAVGE